MYMYSTVFDRWADVEVIEARLDAIDELLHNEDLFESLQAILSRFPDVDHLLALCSQIPKQVLLQVYTY